MQEPIPKRCLVIWFSLLALEAAGSVLAYWTLGWSDALLLFFGSVFLNFVAFVVSATRLRLGVALALGCGLAIVGYQGLLGVRLYFVNIEANRIVEWVSNEERINGCVPEDLSGFEFRHPLYNEYVQYVRWVTEEGVKSQVNYSVGTTATYYSYTKEAGWFYHDD